MATAVAGGKPDHRQDLTGTDSGRASRAERALGWLFAGILAVVAASPIRDNSLLTHIATGRLQADGGLPAENPFLVTSSDFPVPSWWWSASLGWSESALGLSGIRILTVVVAALLGWFVLRVSRPMNSPLSPSPVALGQLLPAAVVTALLLPFLNGRPQLPGFVLLAASLVVWRERRSPWLFVPIFAIWMNVHGSWLYGIAVLALSWAAESIDDRGVDWGRLKWVAAGAGGLVLGGLWYPERFRLLLLPTEQMGSSEARDAIRLYAEWKPVPLSSALLWILGVVVVLALYGAVRNKMLGVGLIVCAMALMGASAQRLLPIAAITVASAAAMGVAAASQRPPIGECSRKVVSAFGVAFLAMAVVMAATPPHEKLDRYPVEEVAWLEERGLVANPQVRVIHNDWVGNYLEYTFGDRASAWTDDRPSVDTVVDYVTLRHMDPGWEEALERADPDVVLWQRADPLTGELAGRGEWETALTTEDFLVLCHARIASRCR